MLIMPSFFCERVSPEDMPPAHVVQEVVLSPGLELLVVSQGVVDPPDTRGHVVG